MRVLVVDDEPIARSSLQALFESVEIDARCAPDASHALSVAEEFRPHAAVVDWMLRDETDGLGIAKQLRAMLPEIRLILTTGFPLDELDNRRDEHDFEFDILGKPFSFDTLLDLIREKN